MSYPIVMFVRSVETTDHLVAKVKADSRKTPEPGVLNGPPQSLYFTLPIEQAPHVGQYLLVTVEISPTPEAVDAANGWQTLEVTECGHPLSYPGPGAEPMVGNCVRPKGHTPPCQLDPNIPTHPSYYTTPGDLTTVRKVIVPTLEVRGADGEVKLSVE